MINFLFSIVSLLTFKTSTGQMVRGLFMFGDSQIDVGNNNYLPFSYLKANFPPNGIDFPHKKATGRFSNGKNAADFIAENVGLPTSPPYRSLSSNNVSAFMKGVSFASGGAGIFNHSGKFLMRDVSLSQQVDDYESVHGEMVQQLGSSAVRKLLSKSLFCLVIGSNDIIHYSKSKGTPHKYVNLMSVSLKRLIMRIHKKGAKKFLVFGVVPIGCTPFQRSKQSSGHCNKQVNSMATSYNTKLQQILHELASSFHHFSYTYFDSYSFVNYIFENPSSYGFTKEKAACCGLGKLRAQMPCTRISKYCSNRSNRIFWDYFHPTEAAAEITIDGLFSDISQYSTPINLRELINSNFH